MGVTREDLQNAAWAEYLRICRDAKGHYCELEPWAWARLQERLELIREAANRSSAKQAKAKVTA